MLGILAIVAALAVVVVLCAVLFFVGRWLFVSEPETDPVVPGFVTVEAEARNVEDLRKAYLDDSKPLTLDSDLKIEWSSTADTGKGEGRSASGAIDWKKAEEMESGRDGEMYIILPDHFADDVPLGSVWVYQKGPLCKRFVKGDGVIITDPDGKITSWIRGDK